MVAGEVQSAQYKNDTFTNLDKPNTWVDMRIIIGLFLFDRRYFPLYELDILPGRSILSEHPQPKNVSKGINVIDEETMDSITPKVNGGVKG